MKTHVSFVATCAATFLFCAAAMPVAARADADACKLLTPAEVGAAVGFPVAAGTHVTPAFVRTCTWTGSAGSQVKAVTLYLQTSSAYDGGKQMAIRMAAASKGAAVKSAAVGDDGYYFVAGTQVGLLVKKGGASFKVAVYATLPVVKKEAMELTLAKKVLPKI
jgi:hypothetical protein